MATKPRVRIDDSDLQKGKRVLDRIADDLSDPIDLAHSYAEEVLKLAVQNASSRPTPQAPMAAANFSVAGDTIRPSAGGVPAAVASGSEFGSDIYLQFQRPHSSQGYWLFPAAESDQAEAAGDNILEQMIDKAVSRG